MKAAQALIAWTPNRDYENDNPTKGKVRVGHLLEKDDPDWTHGYSMTGGAAYTKRREMSGWQQTALVLLDYQRLVHEYGLDPAVVHQAFLNIDEYKAQFE